MAAQVGTIYLLHFSRRISPDHSTEHYLGWCLDLAGRLQEHAAGAGARLTAVALERGIGWSVVRTWTGDRSLERKLKRRHEAPRLCPVCKPTARAERRRPWAVVGQPAMDDELEIGQDYVHWSRVVEEI